MVANSSKPAGQRGLPVWTVPVLVVGGLAVLVWWLLKDPVSTRRSVPDAPMLMLPPPPPPPPPPEPEPELKPREPEPMPEPEPLEEAPKPVEEPPPTPQPESVTMDTEAQAGSDSFGIQRGSGGGRVGAGGGSAGNVSYGRYLGYALQQAVARDERARRFSFQLLIDVWLDQDGKVSRVELVRGSGNQEADSAVVQALLGTQVDERPPTSVAFPARVLVQARRPAG